MSSGLSYADRVTAQRDRNRSRSVKDYASLGAAVATNPRTFSLSTFAPATLLVTFAETVDEATYEHSEPFEVTAGGIVRVYLRVAYEKASANTQMRVSLDLLRRDPHGAQRVVDSFVISDEKNTPTAEDHLFLAADETPGAGSHFYAVRWSVTTDPADLWQLTPTLQRVQPIEYRQGAAS